MASPFGHGVVGAAIARRFGVRSPLGLTAAAIAASLPDGDILVGALFHSDAWTFHRQGTHTLRFALTAGGLAGAAGLVRRDGARGERDLVLDALMGAAIVGSHVPLDNVPLPRLPRGPRLLRMRLTDWLIDAVIWGAVAWAIWPRERKPDADLVSSAY
ncbi:MAG: metal-dependent hydrolase [Chloroflexota bacterium]|nr:metal-dependent hydrolase [Chloroflexota bacterium]